MPRKVARTYLPPRIAPILEFLVERLGLSESEILRWALIEYAEKYGLITDRLRHYKRQT